MQVISTANISTNSADSSGSEVIRVSNLPLRGISADNFLREKQVLDITTLCRSHLYLFIKQGKFPSSITIGVRGARWSEREVRQWVADQIANARKAPAPAAPVVLTSSVSPW